MDSKRNGKRCEFKAAEVCDRMHTLLADDCKRAGDEARGDWHIRRRDDVRHAWDAAASIFCGRPVTGYTQ